MSTPQPPDSPQLRNRVYVLSPDGSVLQTIRSWLAGDASALHRRYVVTDDDFTAFLDSFDQTPYEDGTLPSWTFSQIEQQVNYYLRNALHTYISGQVFYQTDLPPDVQPLLDMLKAQGVLFVKALPQTRGPTGPRLPFE